MQSPPDPVPPGLVLELDVAFRALGIPETALDEFEVPAS